MGSVELFEATVSWLRENYACFRFFTERDIVWTIQTRIWELIEKQTLGYRVFHNFPVIPGKTTDLAILSQGNSVEIAAEFKYEPAHSRKFVDMWPTKFPVVFWEDGVGKDMERIRDFVSKGKAKTAYAILIDEGGYFSWKRPFIGSEWVDWGNGISVLWAQVRKSE